MAPLDKTCIVIEIPYSNDDEIHLMSEIKLFNEISSMLIDSRLLKNNNIIGHTFFNIDYAYPIMEVGTKNKLIPVFNYLNKFQNLYNIGRGAEFKYIHFMWVNSSTPPLNTRKNDRCCPLVEKKFYSDGTTS